MKSKLQTLTIIKLAVSAVVFSVMLVLRIYFKHHQGTDNPKKDKRKKRITLFGMIFSVWFFVAVVVNTLTGGPEGINVELEMFSARRELFGISLADTTITSYIITAVVLVLCLMFRFIAFPRFREKPGGFQNLIELGVEAMENFVDGATDKLSPELPAYMFAIAVYLVGCAVAELLGKRPPSSDLIVTFSMALITFFLINYYGIKKKRLSGRIKAMASPSPILFPMKILSDISVPVSLSCRLFGNMLGGMIVMELMKSALGGYAVGFTALAGIYFNLFHPLIQTYIFIILSLTFIKEATE